MVTAYVLIILGVGVGYTQPSTSSQAYYDSLKSCQNAAAIVERMAPNRFTTACVPTQIDAE